ncbi:hypothetical protein PFICI_00905 [Pestalotiopsis fici W106-1]|uniref:Zn(2)-C6 fungal-type domain-containing protein n=1 Tax=Pestalotiopsis fici (strain W106-1 / CGMCC3.15140) TaxID=1229662 RepID=W3XNI3_PESFW|nr:uncharacterized protein PFICI_00905 [Pestalotiopsis fici W106-1]ETS87077.1 hypothetical protein PFICI_00905 [Pestalotiopsis fici W106-1]
MSPPEQNGGAPKHRACDECRTRKLACTKEADGCGRCKREGITCHYSPQKQMGRPRKRPRDEAGETTTTAESAPKTAMRELPPDTQDPGIAFINFLTGGDVDFDAIFSGDAANQPQDKEPWTFGYTGNDFGTLNFDATSEHAPSFSPSNIDPALFTAGSTPDASVPGLSSAQSSSPAASDGQSASLGPTNCACIASLYLSLDSMQKLPKDVTEAVRQARLAAKTAYQVVNCPCCSVRTLQTSAMEPEKSTPMIHTFQLQMLLATLIPSIVHAYERIIHMVDQETAKAQAERRQIVFTLDNYGGVWGGLNDGCCDSTQALNRTMEPVMWRLTVRALMRVDVYGISACEDRGPGSSSGDPFHLGLKDIVNQMENLSRARHAIIDPLVESGQWDQCANASVLKFHKNGETPTCQKIIQMARMSIDNLVIA